MSALAPITVITPTIPHRTQLLQQCAASVQAQTLLPAYHAVVIDVGYEQGAAAGPSRLRHMALRGSWMTHVAFLDDDDTMDANHLQVLWEAFEDTAADVVYSFCRFDGPAINPIFVNQPYDRAVLSEHGIFPVTVLARREALLDAGSFRVDDQYEDWSLWNRMADNGCKFVCVPEVTWTYRTGHESRTKQAMEGRR